MGILGLQSISRDVADNGSHPRWLEPTIELITYSFVFYLQHGRHAVKCKPSIVEKNMNTIMLIFAVKNILSLFFKSICCFQLLILAIFYQKFKLFYYSFLFVFYNSFTTCNNDKTALKQCSDMFNITRICLCDINMIALKIKQLFYMD